MQFFILYLFSFSHYYLLLYISNLVLAQRIGNSLRSNRRYEFVQLKEEGLAVSSENHNHKTPKYSDRIYGQPELEKQQSYTVHPLDPKALRSRRKKSDSEGESHEGDDFQNQYRLDWNIEMHNAISTTTQGYLGDRVHMMAARPWGVLCGDDEDFGNRPRFGAPKGTCMLPQECEPEFRIYRGDGACGRSPYVCCAVMENALDLIKPPLAADMSFDSGSFATDSTEIRTRLRGAHPKKKKKNEETERRQEERNKRKKEMKSLIKRIVREVSSLLNKESKKSKKEKFKKSKQLKIFLAELKNQYKKDRQAVKDIQEVNVIKIDSALRQKLEELRKLNKDFMKNETFRNIVLNAQKTMTMARTDALKMIETFPELKPYFKMSLRRDNIDDDTIDDEYDWSKTEEKNVLVYIIGSKNNTVKERYLAKDKSFPYEKNDIQHEISTIYNGNLKNYKNDIEYGLVYY